MALREQVVGLGAAAAPVSDVVLSLGPHHPSTHGVLQLALVLDGLEQRVPEAIRGRS